MHGADRAVVTGQEDRLDQPRCEALLATMRALDFTPYRRPGMFRPELPAAPDVPRLLAFPGRDRPAQDVAGSVTCWLRFPAWTTWRARSPTRCAGRSC